ncbi:hypothetical protein FFF34_000830 [Inquilinus sp. KBS0705]|nr:hypothetical protein FFF34_000830 [Inquilinus sp. KBS0705]
MLSAYDAKPQHISYIVLQNEKLKETPTQFYIDRVDDERADHTYIGNVIEIGAAKKPEVYKADVKGGISAIKSFISNSIPVDKNLRPIIIKIKAFTITETLNANNSISGKVNISIAFGLQRDDDFITLGTYVGGNQYQRPVATAQQTEPMLRAAINNSLIYLNKWINAQAGTNPQLAKAVKVIFNNYDETPEGDTIYYSIKRPLKWDDFKAKPRTSSKNGAEIFASIGYTEDVALKNAVFKITLNIKVYVPKSASWVAAGNQSSYALNHEQRHFDIAKIVAERFKRNIMQAELPPYNYDGPINMLYLDALREMNKLQKQYDDETAHSTNNNQQQQWNEFIDKELAKLGIKPSAN